MVKLNAVLGYQKHVMVELLTLHSDCGCVRCWSFHSITHSALIRYCITSNSADADNGVTRTLKQHCIFANLCPLDGGMRDATCITGEGHIITLIHCYCLWWNDNRRSNWNKRKKLVKPHKWQLTTQWKHKERVKTKYKWMYRLRNLSRMWF